MSKRITFEHPEERMFIREPIVRFSPLLDKEVKGYLDELGEVAGGGPVSWVRSEGFPRGGRGASGISLVSRIGER